MNLLFTQIGDTCHRRLSTLSCNRPTTPLSDRPFLGSQWATTERNPDVTRSNEENELESSISKGVWNGAISADQRSSGGVLNSANGGRRNPATLIGRRYRRDQSAGSDCRRHRAHGSLSSRANPSSSAAFYRSGTCLFFRDLDPFLFGKCWLQFQFRTQF